ncbi:AMP-binding protein, partial [Candidatus Poribacteria bacterium]|nr:AMP-binding protein [Candidatus Poribacteria bacterium]
MTAKKLTCENLIECGLDKSTSDRLIERINPLLASLPAAACWRAISQTVLTPDHPFALHQLLHNTVFADWKGVAAPAWFPAEDEIEKTNIAAVMRELDLDSYEALHSWSVRHRTDFWRLMIERLGIQFHQKFSEVVDLSQGDEFPKWLVDAQLNIVESCFNAPSAVTAIVFQSEGSVLSTMTYGELNALTNRVANGLANAGFRPGDPIAINMSMHPESVAIYLGIIKAGSVVIAIADSFAPDEIQMRLRIADAKGIFTQDYIRRAGKQLPLYARVVDAKAPKAIVLSRGDEPPIELRNGDLTWEEFLSNSDRFDAVGCDPHDHTNILFSSGTTGEPKAIPWTQTTP